MSTTELSVDDILRQGFVHFNSGDSEGAKRCFQAALGKEPTNGIANHQLGLISFAAGEHTTAAIHLQNAVNANPGEPEYLNNLGVALNSLGAYDMARNAFESAIAQDPDYLQAHTNLAAALADANPGLALAAYLRALEIDPGCVEARDRKDVICHRLAPQWHFPMMADAARNEAYTNAIVRAVAGRHVLDVGTGSGLLSMIAARAGAATIDTCEAVAPIARVASAIIRENGLSDRISVHSKHSRQLAVGRDLRSPADVLVTETFSSGLLSESILPTVEHAWRHLLSPGAQVIPCRAEARGYLIGGPMVEAQLFAPQWAGLNLSGFDCFAPNKIGIHLDRLPHRSLSSDFTIFSFDLMQKSFSPERRAFSVSCTETGRCAGVAQWLRLDLDSITSYENRPCERAGPNGWMHVVYRFPKPLELAVGDVVELEAVHDCAAMSVVLTRRGET